jgi:hypothetical protein
MCPHNVSYSTSSTISSYYFYRYVLMLLLYTCPHILSLFLLSYKGVLTYSNSLLRNETQAPPEDLYQKLSTNHYTCPYTTTLYASSYSTRPTTEEVADLAKHLYQQLSSEKEVPTTPERGGAINRPALAALAANKVLVYAALSY